MPVNESTKVDLDATDEDADWLRWVRDHPKVVKKAEEKQDPKEPNHAK